MRGKSLTKGLFDWYSSENGPGDGVLTVGISRIAVLRLLFLALKFGQRLPFRNSQIG